MSDKSEDSKKMEEKAELKGATTNKGEDRKTKEDCKGHDERTRQTKEDCKGHDERTRKTKEDCKGHDERRKTKEDCKGHDERTKQMSLFQTTVLAMLAAASLVLVDDERLKLFALVEDFKNNRDKEIRGIPVFNVRRGGGQMELLSLKDIEEDFKANHDLKKTQTIPSIAPISTPIYKTLDDIKTEVNEVYQVFLEEELAKEKAKWKGKKPTSQQEHQAQKAASKGAAERIKKNSMYNKMHATMGDDAEILIEAKLRSALNGRPGLILRGIKTFQHLMKDENKTLSKLGLHLSQSHSAKHETEHDICLVVPDGDELSVTFIQVKRYTIFPWEKDQVVGDKSKQEKNKALGGLVKEQLKQLKKDLKTFVELNPDLDMDRVKVKLVSGLPFTSGDDVMCKECLPFAIVKEDLEGPDWIEKVRAKANISLEATQPTDEVWSMYVQVSSRYGGLLSLVPLKTLGEGLKVIDGAMDQVTSEYESVFVRDNKDETFLKLCAPQVAALCGRVDSTFVTGPYGSGKTVIAKLLVQKFIQEMKGTGTPTLVIMTAFGFITSILDEFRSFAEVHRSEKVEVDVRGWYELLDKYNVKPSDDRLSTINKLTRAMKKAHPNITILLYVDELDQEAVNDNDDFDRSCFDWSALELTITLLLCFRPVAASTRGSDGEILVYPPVRRVHLDRIFRCTNTIQAFLQSFNNFLPDGVDAMRSIYRGSSGLSVPGVTPSWYHVPNHIDSEEGGEEFTKVMAGLSKEITGDVTIIAGGFTNEESSAVAATITRLTAGAHRVVGWTDFFGCEAKSIIVVSPLAAGLHQDLMSRAVATLHIITYSAGDQGERGNRCWGLDLVTVLGKVVEDGKLDRKDPHQGAEYSSEDPGPVSLEYHRLVLEKAITAPGLAQLRKTSPQEHAKVTRPIWAEARSNVEAKEFGRSINEMGFTAEHFAKLQLEDPDSHQTIKDEVMKEVKDRLAPKVTPKQTTADGDQLKMLTNEIGRLKEGMDRSAEAMDRLALKDTSNQTPTDAEQLERLTTEVLGLKEAMNRLTEAKDRLDQK